jgi:hypothetical protein
MILILLNCNQKYANITTLMKTLVQAHVSAPTVRKLKALANTRGQTLASYLRHLIELHVRAVTPRILRALDRTIPSNVRRSR